jgi:hypothetical protein
MDGRISFTWLVHLHLSNEFALANEMAELVAQEPNAVPAGRLVEMWVKVAVLDPLQAVENWITSFPGRNRQSEFSCKVFAISQFPKRLPIKSIEGFLNGSIQYFC